MCVGGGGRNYVQVNFLKVKIKLKGEFLHELSEPLLHCSKFLNLTVYLYYEISINHRLIILGKLGLHLYGKGNISVSSNLLTKEKGKLLIGTYASLLEIIRWKIIYTFKIT